MNEYDFIDKEFCNPQIGVFDNIEKLFPIIGRTHESYDDFSLGTGFLINEDGYFFTAGHVIYDTSRSYFIIVKDHHYKFEVVFLEHEEHSNLGNTICRDLAICKIIGLDFKIPVDYSFSLDCDDKKVYYSGFQLKSSPTKIATIEITSSVYAYLYKLMDEDIKTCKPKKYVKTYNVDYTDYRPMCQNVKSFKTEKVVKGMSGGPVYSNTRVFGMLISNCYILSEYLVGKLYEYKIQYTLT